jgi:hypothetical protein
MSVEGLLSHIQLFFGASSLPFALASDRLISPPLAWSVDERRGRAERQRQQAEQDQQLK